ncbi:hypothetical protein HPB50_017074 [Hyalomma asiaticum]|uniref:Uncharacterized protein n=1 Tax=Hyalomma asiaticum TaxID=266040 RepID=A0ACB7SQV5_HYAAI|nr:hypothetical protein HPB50_017074 [Hyalomma asiaticum]
MVTGLPCQEVHGSTTPRVVVTLSRRCLDQSSLSSRLGQRSPPTHGGFTRGPRLAMQQLLPYWSAARHGSNATAQEPAVGNTSRQSSGAAQEPASHVPARNAAQHSPGAAARESAALVSVIVSYTGTWSLGTSNVLGPACQHLPVCPRARNCHLPGLDTASTRLVPTVLFLFGGAGLSARTLPQYLYVTLLI